MNSSNLEKGLDHILIGRIHTLWPKKSDQYVSVTICCRLTKSLNIQGELLLIMDEIVYFHTIRRPAASASNDKWSHPLLSKMMCCSQEVGKPLKIQIKSVPFYHFPAFQEILSESDKLDRFECIR